MSRTDPSMAFGMCERQKSQSLEWCSFMCSSVLRPSSPSGFEYCVLVPSVMHR
jgi:hypothetical protein